MPRKKRKPRKEKYEPEAFDPHTHRNWRPLGNGGYMKKTLRDSTAPQESDLQPR